MNVYAALMVAVTAAITVLLRFLPFLIFGGEKKTSPYVLYLGKFLPYAIMGMLVIFCLKNISFTVLSGWLPALSSGALVVALHIWKRKTLLSIVAGTVCYMLLVQFVF